MSSRRAFLRQLATTSAAGALAPALLRAAAAPKATYPPVRALTRGPKFHWFGYYDEDQFSADGRFVLGNEVDFDGRAAIAPDFRRLNDVRPGYGYAGLPDPFGADLAPEQTGIWRMDMMTGRQELLFSFAAARALPYTGRADWAFKPDSKHGFNHLLFNTDGTRFFFLHRWRQIGSAANAFFTRAFTCDRDGRDWYCLDPHGRTSHFIWRDPRHVMAWAWHPLHQERFYLYTDKTDRVAVVGRDDMTVNGHNTYLPGTGNAWILSDTYPDAQRDQHPYRYHPATRRKIALGGFFSPPAYVGEWRCDLHPRARRAALHLFPKICWTRGS